MTLLQAATHGDQAPGVLVMAIGPLVAGRRKPSIFRVRIGKDYKKFFIENKSGTGKLGRWRALGESTNLGQAIDAMNKLNASELHKHRLSSWPRAVIQADLAGSGIAVEYLED